MSESQLTSYEDVPYESKPLYPTHPDCLATVATLLGMRPAPQDRCRVLELGCAGGGNLIPMAEALGESSFLGIDLSPRQIADGQVIVDALQLPNIELKAMSLMDVDDSFGTFDYIICHGVYSWVPAAVQDKILEICSRNLAESGVAYVSYNTYPGWHARGMIREMMAFHAWQFADPKQRVQQARAFLDFLVRASGDPERAFAKTLREEADLIRPGADYYLFHEHLEEINQPIYFHQFAERLAGKRLQYLGESWFHTDLSKFPLEVRQTLQELATDLVRLEQYVDFLTNRSFRRTLVCHDRVPLDRAGAQNSIERLYLSALLQPVSPRPDVPSLAVEAFRADNGGTASTNIPLVKALFTELFEAWPQAISFCRLSEKIRDRLAGMQVPDGGHTLESLPRTLLQCYLSNTVALHTRPFPLVTVPGERPVASRLARHQSAAHARITNLRHRIVDVTDADRVVLELLDGAHDRPSLVRRLQEGIRSGILWIDQLGPSSGSVSYDRAACEDWLAGSLRRLAQNGLLTA